MLSSSTLMELEKAGSESEGVEHAVCGGRQLALTVKRMCHLLYDKPQCLHNKKCLHESEYIKMTTSN